VAFETADEPTVLLSDARLRVVERFETGLVDVCFGGGIPRTGVTLLGGDPGAGKTTLCLQIADLFGLREGKEVLYIANEQEAEELLETAVRIRLQAKEKIRVVRGMGGIREDLGDLILQFAPCAIILDSVTKWSGDDLRVAVTLCQRLKDYTVRLRAPSIVINQVTKDGDHAGLNQMQHAVDCTMLFYVDDDPRERRCLYTRKNRFGPAPVMQFFEMTPHGLIPSPDEESHDAARPPSQSHDGDGDFDDDEVGLDDRPH